MLKTLVVGALLLLATVATAAEPLEIRSRLAEVRELDGMITGTLCVEVTNKGPDFLGQVVVRPERERLALFGVHEIVIGDLPAGTTRLVTIPVKAPAPMVVAASVIAPVWSVARVSAGKGGQTLRIHGLQRQETSFSDEGGAR